MKLSTNLQRFHNKTTHYLWIGLFFLIIIGVAATLYFATQQIDYVWRWYRVPTYFVYYEDVEVMAEIEGDVDTITTTDEKATIVVKGLDDEEEAYSVPSTEDIRVSEGDMIYPGDVLATYGEWRPGILLQGLWITLKVSVYAIVLGIIIGLFGGLARISSNPAAKWLAITYVEFIRGSPLLVQIFIWYFVLGTLINTLMANRGLDQIPALWYGTAALAFFAGAYVTEIVRAGIQSIHRGQFEASRSLGMSYTQAMRHVILPQAMRRILPPLAGQFISLIKDSSLLGIIAVRELTKATREVITASLQPFELFFTCALLYLVITFTLSMLVQYLERRLAS
ncbi:ABC transporter permease subunit [candidate division KSB3 bacterium]|uniref:ABC transporter permease subunit n=1 Tax=candidate division KSB3 bacterium TaxID=2044937 RepID=A0A9D5JWH6_9BACT|nr:ABC transporter permease subunit [candidate division KSB3 bacterium]MBD3325562.1 ABC transporter permease subunit [candidate division KSB3 bacterium]